MSKRLQVLLNPQEFSWVQRMSAQEHKSISQWVRDLIRKHLARKKIDEDIDIIKEMRKLELPAPPIEQMLEEIERGRF